jgi:WD40 repeat protein
MPATPGGGTAEFTAVVGKVAAAVGSRTAVFVVGSARAKQEAAEGALSSALEEALANADGKLGGATQRFLALDEVMESVDSYLRTHSVSQTATWSSINVVGRARLFPNVRFQPQVQPGLDLEEQQALLEHWIPKAMGTEVGATGWYFTGREAALKELVEWLSGDLSDSRVRVVTGSAGCGKSALLARIVTLSDPATRRTALSNSLEPVPASLVPPEHAVDVSVHARRKVLADIVRLIGERLGVATVDPTELIEAIRSRHGKTVIVLDALDEADQRDLIVQRVLIPLTALPNVLLLIGTRPDAVGRGRRFRAMGESTVEIDLDAPSYFDMHDVERYVERRLLAREEPNRPTHYRNRPQFARIVANGVATLAGKFFLLARTTVQALLAADKPIDISQPAWIKALPTGLDEAFKQFLAGLDTRASGDLSSTTVRAVLLPLANAEGEGLPWATVWPCIASALSGTSVNDGTISAVLKEAGAFIVEAQEAERSVYRLYHQEFADWLCRDLDSAEVHSRIFDALIKMLPESEGRGDWTRAHPYILVHLAAHAAKAQRLGELLGDLQYLLMADRQRLIEHLPSLQPDESRSIGRAYRQASSFWLPGMNEQEKSAYLALALLQEGATRMYERLAASHASALWIPIWAQTRRHPPSFGIARSDIIITALVASYWAPVKTAALVGRQDGSVEVWDLDTNMRLAEWKPEGLKWPEKLAFVRTPRSHILVAAWRDGELGAMDLGTGEEVILPCDPGQRERVLALCIGELDDKPICVVAREHSRFVVHSLPSLTTLSERRDPRADAYALEVVKLGEDYFLVAAGDTIRQDRSQTQSRLQLWSFPGLDHLWEDGRARGGYISQFQCFRYSGRTLLVASGSDNFPQVWDLDARTLVYSGTDTTNWAQAIELDGRALLVSKWIGPLSASYMVFSTEPEMYVESIRNDIEFEYQSMLSEIVWLHGRPVFLGAGNNQVQVWDVKELVLGSRLQQGDQLCTNPSGALTVNLRTMTEMYMGTCTGEVVALDAETGSVKWKSSTNKGDVVFEGSRIGAVVYTQLRDQNALLVGGYGGIEILDPVTGDTLHQRIALESVWVETLAVTEKDGVRLVFATVEDKGKWYVRLWNLDSGEEVRPQDWDFFAGQEDKSLFSLAVSCLKDFVRVAYAGRGHVMVGDLCQTAPSVWTILKYWIWRIPGGSGIEYIRSMETGWISDTCILFAGTDDGRLTAWDFRSGAIRSSKAHVHQENIWTLSFLSLHDNGLLVSGGEDCRLRFWTPDLEEVFTIQMGESIRALAWLGPGRLAVGTTHGIVMLRLDERQLQDLLMQ